MQKALSILLFALTLANPSPLSALTVFGNWGRCGGVDHRYYPVGGYYPRYVGYQDIDNYPYTYQLPWNRCFNYCTRCPKSCFCTKTRH